MAFDVCGYAQWHIQGFAAPGLTYNLPKISTNYPIHAFACSISFHSELSIGCSFLCAIFLFVILLVKLGDRNTDNSCTTSKQEEQIHSALVLPFLKSPYQTCKLFFVYRA